MLKQYKKHPTLIKISIYLIYLKKTIYSKGLHELLLCVLSKNYISLEKASKMNKREIKWAANKELYEILRKIIALFY